jgi:hypothetical protein
MAGIILPGLICAYNFLNDTFVPGWISPENLHIDFMSFLILTIC